MLEKANILANILVIDDEKDMCDAISDALEEKGYKVRSVDNPAKALEMLKREVFNVIIADVMIPEIRIPDFLNEVKELSLKSSTIIMTGYTTADERVDRLIKSDSCDYYIKKPFGLDELYGVVSKALERLKGKS